MCLEIEPQKVADLDAFDFLDDHSVWAACFTTDIEFFKGRFSLNAHVEDALARSEVGELSEEQAQIVPRLTVHKLSRDTLQDPGHVG